MKERGAPWILKPNALSRGRGIRIVDSISQVSPDECCVVTRYGDDEDEDDDEEQEEE